MFASINSKQCLCSKLIKGISFKRNCGAASVGVLQDDNVNWSP